MLTDKQISNIARTYDGEITQPLVADLIREALVLNDTEKHTVAADGKEDGSVTKKVNECSISGADCVVLTQESCPECEKSNAVLEENYTFIRDLQQRYDNVVSALCKAVAKT